MISFSFFSVGIFQAPLLLNLSLCYMHMYIYGRTGKGDLPLVLCQMDL